MADPSEITAQKAGLPALISADFDLSKWGISAFDLSKWGLSSSDSDLSKSGPSASDLAEFDLPHRMVLPLLWSFRQINTLADALFYDVNLLWLRLFTRGITLTATNTAPPVVAHDGLAALQAAAKFINLSALANPEGVILVIDAHHAPFVQKFDDVKLFLKEGLTFPSNGEAGSSPKDVHIIAVTGVGSSALGSAAFAWNISESLHEPVAAIVPGYGLADLIPQALGGWFGFGVHDFIRRFVQQALAQAAPEIATIGRRLSLTAPNASPVGEAVFRSGSPESDILHQILEAKPQIKRLYGHSKGALCIQNAIRDLPKDRYGDLHVTTFGCVVQEETGADYNQVLGNIDGLGQLNSWGNWPEQWIKSWHSTNSMLPGAMPIADLVKKDVRDEDPVTLEPEQLQAAIKAALKALLPPTQLTLPIAPKKGKGAAATKPTTRPGTRQKKAG
jgi:hypothetical protein